MKVGIEGGEFGFAGSAVGMLADEGEHPVENLSIAGKGSGFDGLEATGYNVGAQLGVLVVRAEIRLVSSALFRVGKDVFGTQIGERHSILLKGLGRRDNLLIFRVPRISKRFAVTGSVRTIGFRFVLAT